ncbi:MAG: DUF4190 domain-containing protein [Acidobacteriota bacterium]|nr:DUF4190 domain-containing protein [Acidobacteriota bacterium]
MKRCPSCQRTFPDEAPNFCPNDGQRLVNEESAAFDPEKTVMTSGRNLMETPKQEATPTEPQPPPQSFQPKPSPPSAPQLGELAQQQQWQPPGGGQFPQQGWQQQPQTPVPPSQTPQAWVAPYQQQPAAAPYAAPFVPQPSGERSRALAIAAIVCGVDAATIMALTIIRTIDFTRIILWALPVLGIGLGMSALILALKKPTRFGGVELAIAGLALGVAALVYVLLNRF